MLTDNLLVCRVVKRQGWKGIPRLAVAPDELSWHQPTIQLVAHVLLDRLHRRNLLQRVVGGEDLARGEVVLREVLLLLKPEGVLQSSTPCADSKVLEGVGGACVRPVLLLLQDDLRRHDRGGYQRYCHSMHRRGRRRTDRGRQSNLQPFSHVREFQGFNLPRPSRRTVRWRPVVCRRKRRRCRGRHNCRSC